jgi:hypothetical protein
VVWKKDGMWLICLSFFLWPLSCLSFYLQILITPLVSSNCSLSLLQNVISWMLRVFMTSHGWSWQSNYICIMFKTSVIIRTAGPVKQSLVYHEQHDTCNNMDSHVKDNFRYWCKAYWHHSCSKASYFVCVWYLSQIICTFVCQGTN